MNRALVHWILKNGIYAHDWTEQGFGFLRLRISEDVRIHVWDSRLRVPKVSDIHDHAQWDFSSLVLSGQLINVRYNITDDGEPYCVRTIVCGTHGDNLAPVGGEQVRLSPSQPEIYIPGNSYSQEAGEIHKTVAEDGTVTIIKQTRHDTDTARVFWPDGARWGDAKPKSVESDIIRPIVEDALLKWRS